MCLCAKEKEKKRDRLRQKSGKRWICIRSHSLTHIEKEKAKEANPRKCAQKWEKFKREKRNECHFVLKYWNLKYIWRVKVWLDLYWALCCFLWLLHSSSRAFLFFFLVRFFPSIFILVCAFFGLDSLGPCAFVSVASPQCLCFGTYIQYTCRGQIVFLFLFLIIHSFLCANKSVCVWVTLCLFLHLRLYFFLLFHFEEHQTYFAHILSFYPWWFSFPRVCFYAYAFIHTSSALLLLLLFLFLFQRIGHRHAYKHWWWFCSEFLLFFVHRQLAWYGVGWVVG